MVYFHHRMIMEAQMEDKSFRLRGRRVVQHRLLAERARPILCHLQALR